MVVLNILHSILNSAALDPEHYKECDCEPPCECETPTGTKCIRLQSLYTLTLANSSHISSTTPLKTVFKSPLEPQLLPKRAVLQILQQTPHLEQTAPVLWKSQPDLTNWMNLNGQNRTCFKRVLNPD